MSDWQPTASLANLRLRAELLAQLRRFFAERGVLEVDTPALARAGATDRHIHSFRVEDSRGGYLYLHTSPEFPMKRLLAAGSGDIWQLCKVFRSGEAGRMHNPEFSMLEWYRLGFDHHRLMAETAELIAILVPGVSLPPEKLTYREAFQLHAGLDPFSTTPGECRAVLERAGHHSPKVGELDLDGWLDLLAGERVYPALGKGGLTFIYDYPVSQAALARLRPGDPPVAERFEAFLQGMELANGFHELTDVRDQRHRFEADRNYRNAQGLMDVPTDERLLAALEQGLPPCAGVAVGFDRLVMAALKARTIEDVIAFPSERA